MSSTPLVRLLVAALSFGGGTAAGLLAASLARREVRERRSGGVPDRAWRVGGHAYTEHIPHADDPVAEELDLYQAPELELDFADPARRS